MKLTETKSTDVPVIDPALAVFDQLPDSAFVRLRTVRAWRGGVSAATIWRHVKLGLLPQPEKIGPNSTGWRVGALREKFAQQARG